MFWLLLVSVVWAFSFGLVKRLTGLDSVAVSVVRIAFAALVFAPWIRVGTLQLRQILQLIAIGAVQFGVMYLAYIRAYGYLQAYEVALFTIFTPLYLTLFDAALERRWRMQFLVASVLAVLGAGVALWQQRPDNTLFIGFALVQLSNLCFAAGQLFYRRVRANAPPALTDRNLFGWLCLGALLATAAASAVTTSWGNFRPAPSQWTVLLYLGVVASGLGFFFWNRGATQVNAGTLAAFNNAKIPLGIACSLLFFGERADPIRLGSSGLLLLAAIFVAQRAPQRETP